MWRHWPASTTATTCVGRVRTFCVDGVATHSSLPTQDFKERCVHAVAFIERKQLASACTGGRKKSCRVHIAVWARRALFGLSAHPSTKIVLDGIDPAGKRHPCRAPLAEDGTFSRSDPPLSSFTIKALLRDAESSGIAVPKAFAKSMDGLLADGIQLRPYQTQNVFWALHQEDRKHTAKTSVAGLNGYYWERRAFVDGGDFYYFPHGGHVFCSSRRPSCPAGY